MTVQYDRSVIHEHARKLYDRALGIIILYALGLGVPALVGVFMVTSSLPLAAFFGVLAGVLGGLVGQGKAFELRLQAQLALCQARIEKNTEAAVQLLTSFRAPPPVPPQHHAPHHHAHHDAQHHAQPQSWGAMELNHGSGYPVPRR